MGTLRTRRGGGDRNTVRVCHLFDSQQRQQRWSQGEGGGEKEQLKKNYKKTNRLIAVGLQSQCREKSLENRVRCRFLYTAALKGLVKAWTPSSTTASQPNGPTTLQHEKQHRPRHDTTRATAVKGRAGEGPKLDKKKRNACSWDANITKKTAHAPTASRSLPQHKRRTGPSLKALVSGSRGPSPETQGGPLYCSGVNLYQSCRCFGPPPVPAL